MAVSGQRSVVSDQRSAVRSCQNRGFSRIRRMTRILGVFVCCRFLVGRTGVCVLRSGDANWKVCGTNRIAVSGWRSVVDVRNLASGEGDANWKVCGTHISSQWSERIVISYQYGCYAPFQLSGTRGCFAWVFPWLNENLLTENR